MQNRHRLHLSIPLAAALLLAGCGTTRIGRILDEPQHYFNRPVRVNGTVSHSFGAIVTGVYAVDDGSGRIYVLSNGGGVPRNGSRVTVKGHVMNGVVLGNRSFGTAIREQSHHVNY
jgi:hypothetical protein